MAEAPLGLPWPRVHGCSGLAAGKALFPGSARRVDIHSE